MIKRGNITRFVFVYSQANDPVLEFIKQYPKIHYVVIGSPYTDKETTYYVDNDNFKAGYDATKFLLAKGRLGSFMHILIFLKRFKMHGIKAI